MNKTYHLKFSEEELVVLAATFGHLSPNMIKEDLIKDKIKRDEKGRRSDLLSNAIKAIDSDKDFIYKLYKKINYLRKSGQ